MIRCTFCDREFELSELADAILLKSNWSKALYQFRNKEIHQFKFKDLKREPISAATTTTNTEQTQ
jgi:hypothetical protein